MPITDHNIKNWQIWLQIFPAQDCPCANLGTCTRVVQRGWYSATSVSVISSGGSRISRRGGMDLVGGAWTPRQLCFKKFVCQNERIWTLGGRAPGMPPLDPPVISINNLYVYIFKSCKIRITCCQINMFRAFWIKLGWHILCCIVSTLFCVTVCTVIRWVLYIQVLYFRGHN